MYLILQEVHCLCGQKPLVPVLDGQRQVLVEHLHGSLVTQCFSYTLQITCVVVKCYMSEDSVATHTLHQVESLFGEEILFPAGREPHRLPELSLCERQMW